EIRLVNGSHNCSGRLEVYNEDQWGTMCYVLIHIAQLVCRDLGCGYAAFAPQASLFGEGTGPVWNPSIGCVPGKSQAQCSITSMETTSCNHSEDAGVICSDILNIRLANGANNCSGRVEFYYKDQWEAGCGDYWDMRHAQVVCRELGCGYAVSASVGARFGNRTAPYWRKGYHCSGEEQSLISCFVKELTTCHKDVSVICSEIGFDIRLINGSNNCSGRVELYFEGQRRRMCDDGWDNATAHVVCKQLGCGYAVSPQEGALFGEGTDPSWLLGLSCKGRESSLERCLSGQNGIQECTDGSAVSVICSVCGSYWDMNDAQVVCRELGCGSAVSALRGSQFGEGQEPVWQYIMECTGRESSLERCDSQELLALPRRPSPVSNTNTVSCIYCKISDCFWGAKTEEVEVRKVTGVGQQVLMLDTGLGSGNDLLDFISSSTFSTVRCVFIICYLLVMSIAVIIERAIRDEYEDNHIKKQQEAIRDEYEDNHIKKQQEAIRDEYEDNHIKKQQEAIRDEYEDNHIKKQQEAIRDEYEDNHIKKQQEAIRDEYEDNHIKKQQEAIRDEYEDNHIKKQQEAIRDEYEDNHIKKQQEAIRDEYEDNHIKKQQEAIRDEYEDNHIKKQQEAIRDEYEDNHIKKQQEAIRDEYEDNHIKKQQEAIRDEYEDNHIKKQQEAIRDEYEDNHIKKQQEAIRDEYEDNHIKKQQEAIRDEYEDNHIKKQQEAIRDEYEDNHIKQTTRSNQR
ncbi:UNVERIFIED_CONTAM: hypothetical protein FKN15_020062, partial [Acipenser sinensis]